jgi:hypothetical protein
VPKGRTLAALLVVLALAAGLRFAGLDRGLRHTPHWDERVFVENAREMVRQHSLDHRYYEYPGLLFYVLAPVLALLRPETLDGPAAYLASRGVIAAFGVTSVFLVFRLGSLMAGTRAGLAAALLLAVSPLEVVTAHAVRPDVVLESFVLLALLAFRQLGPEARGDAAGGAAVGAAAAVKFTGLLLVPSYLAARLLAPGERFRRMLLAGLLAALVWLLFTPYALIHLDDYLGGVRVQMGAHYRGGGHTPSFLDQIRFYLGVLPWALGPAGAAVVTLGLLTLRREWRAWTPLLLHPLTTLLVLSTAELHYERHLVPTLGVLALLAGRAIAVLAERRAWWGGVTLLAAVLPPLWGSLGFARDSVGPGPRDLALDWIQAHAAPGARIVTELPELGLDRGRFEVVPAPDWKTLGHLLARRADLVVASEERPGLVTLFVARPRSAGSGSPVLVQRPAPDPGARALRLGPGSITVSEHPGQAPALVDGRLDTSWRTVGPQRPGSWIELDLGGPVRVTAVELLLDDATTHGQLLHLRASDDGGRTWRRLATVSARPAPELQRASPRSQLLLLDPVEASRLRIVQLGKRRKPWGAAEVRVEVTSPAS